MVDLDSVEAWPDERPAQGAAGDNLLRASAASGFTKGIKVSPSVDEGEETELYLNA